LNNIVAIDAVRPDPMILRQARHTLRKGGLVVIPTRHLYGLAVDALNPKAVQRVFAIKRRPLHQPLLILIPSRAAVAIYVQDVDVRAEMLMEAFWPGKLTIIFKARPLLPSILTGGTGRIGLRLPEHAVCRELVALVGRPITATSANISGQPGCHGVADLPPTILSAADLVLNAGALEPGKGSTVVDVQPGEVQVLREGAVPLAAIREAMSCPVVALGERRRGKHS
jgi:L-threonylcarbamoyladenylate synthase